MFHSPLGEVTGLFHQSHMAPTWQVGFCGALILIRASMGERAEKRSTPLMASTVREKPNCNEAYLKCWKMAAGGDMSSEVKICGQNAPSAGSASYVWGEMRREFDLENNDVGHWVSFEELEDYTQQQDRDDDLNNKQRAKRRVERAQTAGFTPHAMPVQNYGAPTLTQLDTFHGKIRDAPAQAWVLNDYGGEGRLGMFLMAEQGYRRPPAQQTFGVWLADIRAKVVDGFARCDPGEFFHNRNGHQGQQTQKKNMKVLYSLWLTIKGSTPNNYEGLTGAAKTTADTAITGATTNMQTLAEQCCGTYARTTGTCCSENLNQ